LGHGLEQLGRAGTIERLACEVLPNRTVIARDAGSGAGYVVQPAVTEELTTIPVADLEPLDEPDPSELLDTIDSAGSADEACALALDVAHQLVQAESGSVILYDSGQLVFVCAHGPHADRVLGQRIPLGAGVAGYAMQKQRSVVLGNASDDPRHYPGFDRITGYETHEIACVPVLHDPRVFGVIELLNLPAGRRFSRHDIHQLQAVANALAGRLARESETADGGIAGLTRPTPPT
jgi:putative methionine-R-sulfoxide reductase with GAF domain